MPKLKPEVANPQPTPDAVTPAPVLTTTADQDAAIASGADVTIGAPGEYTTATGLTVTTFGFTPAAIPLGTL